MLKREVPNSLRDNAIQQTGIASRKCRITERYSDSKYDGSSIVTEASYCCLCYQVLSSKRISIYEEVVIRGQESLKLIDVLCNVLSDQFVTNVYTLTASTYLCEQCAHDASSSYKFISMCKQNYEMRSSGENINNCLDIEVKEGESCESEKNTQANESITKHDIKTESKKKQRRRSKKLDLNGILHPNSTSTELKCKMCLKTFSRAKNLRNHYIRVHFPKTFKCSECSLTYGSELYLHVHKKLCHKQVVVCSQCGKGFTNIHTMRRHEKSHVLRYTCAHCNKEYKTKHALRYHLNMKLCGVTKSLNGEKFPCEHCSKKFGRRDSLHEHIRFMHKDGKCFTCTWCSKKLNCFSKLQEHVVVHTKDKKFPCKLCGAKFVSKNSLLYHTRTHTGDKPYKCDQCDESFLNTSRRTQHIKYKHMNLKIQCDICLVTFTRHCNLLRHKRKHADPESKLHSLHAKTPTTTEGETSTETLDTIKFSPKAPKKSPSTDDEKPAEIFASAKCFTVVIKEEVECSLDDNDIA